MLYSHLTIIALLSNNSDVHIWPDVPELTLTSGADLTLTCTADVPVKWNHTLFDSDLSMKVEKVRIIYCHK